jgi:Amidohydrolase family
MRFVVLLFTAVGLTPWLSGQPIDTTFYSYVAQGKIVGKQWACENEKNSYSYYDEYNDRGRGPSIYSHLRTDDNGVITDAEFHGVDYYKASVQEEFHVRNSKAFWKNKFENDSAGFAGELYSDINGPIAEYELILKMLQRSTAGEVHVLPGGIRRFRYITEAQILGAPDRSDTLRGSTAKGKLSPLNLKLVAFDGFGGGPWYIWFKREGQFFGFLNPTWMSLIQTGYEDQIAELYVIQKQVEQNFYTHLAQTLTTVPKEGLAIRNALLFDPASGKTSGHQTVLVFHDKIIKAGNAADVTIPSDYQIIDGTGKFLMPGLWDMHTHYSKEDGPFKLAQGVTNIRDMGNGPELLGIRTLTNQDSLLGPDITVISGLIDKAGVMAVPVGILVNTLDEALQAVRDYKKKGYDQIKLYSSIEPQWVKPIADESHRLGMRVCGHIPAFMTASQAVEAGYDEITHINMLFLNFFGDTIDTRNMTRLTLPGEKGYTIDVKGQTVQQFITLLKKHGTVLDPTLSAFEDNYIQLPGQMSRTYIPIAAYLPAEIHRASLNGNYLGTDSLVDTYARSFQNMKKMVKELYASGLILLAGTDGGILQHELELYSEAGIPNSDVLKMATYWPAKVSGKENTMGSISAGKTANMILVDGDPLQNMQDIRKVYLTIKEGNLYWPKEIYKTFGWGYYYN